ncbi:serine hydrolase domain-containing protein [Phenylobacterium terrae]|uniref:Serine hydrolase domain-containing protein n=1 Tax=Phenylobacterium terrae TaxID=2665495 RepID=A0ABW4N3R4_9CAUL
MPETLDTRPADAAPAAQAAPEARPSPSGSTWRHRGALAAAYKALYVATGRFTAGLSEAQLKADIFEGAPMGKIVDGMTAQIDDAAKTVSVSYADDMPPRIAAWRPVLGATQLPIGATAEAVKHLPNLPADVRPPSMDDLDWPNGDRNATAPGSARLEAVVEAAFEPGKYGGVTWGVAVLKGGKILSERYGRGYDMHTPQRTNSAAKSVAATVVGAAVKQGLLDIHARPVLPEWSRPGDPRGQITLNDLLHMASGLYTEAAGNPQQELYFGGAAAAERSALNIMDSPPGARWVYSGSDTILAIRALRAALGDDARHLRFPFEEVLWKIGMTRTVLEVDWNGDFLMSGDMWSTVRDMARFALLYAGGGVWNGERILPEDWPAYVATPAPAQPSYPDGRGYGAQFWLFGPGQGLPEGCYTAAGARGQYAMIVPEHDLIVVRRGFDLEPGFKLAKFVADVIEAVKAP